MYRPVANFFHRGTLLIGKRRHQDVFENRALRQKMVQLKNETDLFVSDSRQLLLAQSGKILTVEQHFSAGRIIQGAHDIQKRAFAAAGWAENDQRPARLYL